MAFTLDQGADAGAVENRGPSGEKGIVGNRAAAEVGAGAHQNMIAEHRGMALAASDDGGFHDDAVVAHGHRPALGGNHGAKENTALGADRYVTGKNCVGGNAGTFVDIWALAAMADDHG